MAGKSGAADGVRAAEGVGGVIRVLVADDHAAVRTGVVLVLGGTPDIEVVGEASDGVEAVELARRLHPDIVLMDIRMPRLDGIAATRQPRGVADVVILTTFDLDEYVFGALRAGAVGFLLKDTEADALIEAVRVVARGDGLISPSVTRRVIEAFAALPAPAEPPTSAGTPTARPEPYGNLTAREREVARPHRPGTVQRGDGPRAGNGGGYGEDAHQPGARETRPTEPGAGGDHGAGVPARCRLRRSAQMIPSRPMG